MIPALIRRFHEAVKSGEAASVFIMNLDDATYRDKTQPMIPHINVGTGVDCTIRELAETLARATGFAGKLVFGASKKDGMLRKLMDVSRLKNLGWQVRIGLEVGLHETYAWFMVNQNRFRS